MKKLIIILAAATFLGACNNSAKQEDLIEEAVGEAKEATIDSINAVNEIRQQTIDSMKNEEQTQTVVTNHIYTTPKNPGNSGSGGNTVTTPVSPATPTSGTTAASAPTNTVAAKKKGLNNTAKGALIGAGTGAVAGALIDKKRGEGAIVGGLIGAGAGAIGGLLLDKNKKKKAAADSTRIADSLKNNK